MPKYSSNGFIRMGAPISATLRCTTNIEYSSTSNSEDVITTTGDVGPTRGIGMATISATCAVPVSGTEVKSLLRASQNGDQIDTYVQMGPLVFHALITIKSYKAGSATNKSIDISLEMSGEELPVQDA